MVTSSAVVGSSAISSFGRQAMTIAVNGMLPNTTLGRKALTRLRCYAGAEHNNAAQKPVEYKI